MKTELFESFSFKLRLKYYLLFGKYKKQIDRVDKNIETIYIRINNDIKFPFFINVNDAETYFKFNLENNYYLKENIYNEKTYFNSSHLRHRIDGPAFESKHSKKWYINGKLYRNNGPAIEHVHNNVYENRWYINGKRHRIGGPAIEILHNNVLSTKFWFFNDKLHREDGPAQEYSDGTKKWYLNGKKHRVDGPAIEYNNGDKEWIVNGKHHRIDGPAIDMSNRKEWWINGKLHRIDGPAIMYPYNQNDNVWCLNNNWYTEKEFNEIKNYPMLW